MFGNSVYQIGAALSRRDRVRRVDTTKAEALSEWRNAYLPSVVETYEADGVKDLPARRMSWTTFVDALHRNGAITDRQARTWCQPPECQR